MGAECRSLQRCCTAAPTLPTQLPLRAQVSLCSLRGRAVPFLPLLVYGVYTCAVCGLNTLIVGGVMVRAPAGPAVRKKGFEWQLGARLLRSRKLRRCARQRATC
jgi:hypothetical protein